MKKISTLSIVLLALVSLSAFAGPPAMQFQFTSIDLTQNSWDYACLHYNVNDLSTGEVLQIPSFLIHYEIKDNTGTVVSKGSGLYVNVADAKLGSEEEYTIAVSTTINGQKVTRSLCRKASPKKFAMKVNANDLDNNNLAYTVTRPKFNNPNENENIQVSASDVAVNVALDNNNYKIEVGAGHSNIADQAAYQDLKAEMKNLNATGKVAEMTIEPSLTFKGQVYTDAANHYEVTAAGITEINPLDAAVASK